MERLSKIVLQKVIMPSIIRFNSRDELSNYICPAHSSILVSEMAGGSKMTKYQKIEAFEGAISRSILIFASTFS
jgi:hypothetical protein